MTVTAERRGALELARISPSGPIDAAVALPGSKSFTHRALICAALAEGESRLRGALEAEDTALTAQALNELGAAVTFEEGAARVRGTAGSLAPPAGPLHLGNSGTSIRLLTAVASLCQAAGETVLDGNEAMRRRPIGELVRALNELGVAARCQEGFPPVVVPAQGLAGGRCELDASQSSQFISAILLAAPYARSDVEVNIRGTLVSRPYVEMTIQTMADFGVLAEAAGARAFRVACGQRYQPRDYLVEADASGASYFLAAAAATRGRVRVSGLRQGSLQGDMGFLNVLAQMGCQVRREGEAVEVVGGPLAPLDIDMGKMPDVVPTLAVLAALAPGVSRIRNIRHLRLKECDRLRALATELNRCGVRAVEEPAALIIHGGNPHGAEIETYDDHRLAMSFAVLGLAVEGVAIRNPACVAKSFPDFWERFERLHG